MRRATFIVLCGVIFVMPFESMLFIDETFSGIRVLGLALVAFGICGVLEGKPLRLFNLPMLVMMLYFGWCAISVVWSADPERTISTLQRLGGAILLVWVIWEFCRTRYEVMWLLRVYLLGHVVPFCMLARDRSAAIGHLDSDDILRVSGGGHDPNYLSSLIVLGIIMADYLISATRKGAKVRWLYGAFIVLAIPAVLLTGSRAGFLGLLMVTLWAIVYHGARGRILAATVMVGATFAIAYLVAPLVVPEATLNRMIGFGNYRAEDVADRWKIWQQGFVAFEKRPLQGFGLGAFHVTQDESGGRRATVAHSIVVSILVELGIVGLLLYLTLLGLIIQRVLRLPRNDKIFWLGILAVWMAFSLSGSTGTDHLTWFVMAMAMTVSAAPVPAMRQTRIAATATSKALGLPKVMYGGNQWRKQ